MYWMIASEMGANNFELRYVKIPVGASCTYGKHPHEHEVFVLKGKGILKGKDCEIELKPDLAVFVAENEEHQWINTGDETLCFICVVPKGAESEYKPDISE